MATLRCKEPFSADIDGVPRTIPGGALIDSSDPIVKGREHLFETVDVYMAGRESKAAPVESASAAPGEKRSVRAPKVAE
jgi:hypothetical protein